MPWLCLLLMAFALPSLASEPAGTMPAPLPVEYFTQHDDFGDLKISPDGQFYAVTAGRYGRSELAFIQIEGMELATKLSAPEGFEIHDFHWVSDVRAIYTIAERQPGLVRPTPTGEIFAVDRNGKNQQFIYGYRAGQKQTGTRMRVREFSYATPEVVSTLRKDDKQILIAEYPWREGMGVWYFDPDAKPEISLLDVKTGRKRSLERIPLAGATVLVDRDDHVRFAVGKNETFRDAVIWKRQPDAPWSSFELPGFEESSMTPLLFGRDNQSVLFTGVHTGASRAALYRLDLATQAVREVHAFDHGDVEGLILDFAARDAVGVVGYTDKPVHHWLNAEDSAARLYSALFRAFPGHNVRVTSTTRDGRLAIVFVDSDVNPGDFYVFDTEKKAASFLQPSRSWIDPRQMRPREPFSMKARDGLVLHGYVTRPGGEGPHPLVVLPHGGPHGVRDTWTFDWEAQLLANRGYAVLQVNFRGSGGYGLAFQKAGYRQWGKAMQDDVTDATHWAIERKIADPNRICIYGASYGGYSALMGAIREPQLYRCAIGYAGVYDLELMLSSADIPRSRSGRNYLRLALGNDRADLQDRSPTHHAEAIRAPVLLIHGKADGRADFEQAKRMKEALDRHAKPYEWMALSREGHGVYDEENRREVYEKVLSFLAQHLR